jgi:hypothetical protein
MQIRANIHEKFNETELHVCKDRMDDEVRRLMDELHEKGRKVDCLDFLIRTTEKEMKQANH